MPEGALDMARGDGKYYAVQTQCWQEITDTSRLIDQVPLPSYLRLNFTFLCVATRLCHHSKIKSRECEQLKHDHQQKPLSQEPDDRSTYSST